ncbi:UDP-N-acetylglucosamine 2-epimerase (non-hydrolyzing) [Pusillimonas sp. CC-YST705]|uniref:UDP-N-acetylglucosamine 2-epimerase (Non-hydrolyzing) n=1 Tax=Mesopusillimonas faecipullorum TaxID=2755040 RepID=A0ABS8CB32_9BURK|nr:UDP-N-acetylglucosamine 2-epimerase (non-hydrolyzing) [Mesopusillimonas faecipullorum]MCB5363228.1 UDP-N-acetylglucosamine 2-epimerase (non-hydrolyzing) [Mesopusillimonas faecipullorum]
MKKIITIVGARPQFIKASVVSKSIKESGAMQELVVHTGQHFDANMSDVFFEQLGISKPAFELGIHSAKHGEMTGRMLIEIEKILIQEQADRVMVYGDTNSTLAGALAASKLHIPVAHVEAGLRSFNMQMPEEINRILTDQLSDILFCPTETAVSNLRAEGFESKPVAIHNVGDVMQDAALHFAAKAVPPSGLQGHTGFILATLHRAENTDDLARLADIVQALNDVHKNLATVVLPLHPRTRKAIQQAGIHLEVEVIDPVGYLEMIWLLEKAELVMTDSGGVQKEAFFFGKSCVTLRDQTEWVELVEVGANTLVGADPERIRAAAQSAFGRRVQDTQQLYGGGQAAARIVALMN